ncbi:MULTISPECIES: hypothetical protein [unclassified Pseudomonas]|uniref:hypothetical protein n=1 Tax=unclassified Pseudomonas TaxID=196821 RepID=UPI00131B41B6|nr:MULTISPECIES: hypothetical protein [unclassified Pseudomonas]
MTVLLPMSSDFLEISVRTKKIELPVQRILNLLDLSSVRCLFACGSFIEGIGNSLSDLDIIVIHSSDNEREISVQSRSEEIYLEDLCLNIDFEHWIEDEIHSVLCSVSEASIAGRVYHLSLFTATPSFKESRLLHNLLTATPIYGSKCLSTYIAEIKIPEYSVMRFNSIAASYEDMKDIFGMYFSEEKFLANELLREYLITQLQALTHLNFNTNFRRKWLYNYANKLPSTHDHIMTDLMKILYSSDYRHSEPSAIFLHMMFLLKKIFAAFYQTIGSSSPLKDALDVSELLTLSGDFSAERNRALDFRKAAIGINNFNIERLLSKNYWGL